MSTQFEQDNKRLFSRWANKYDSPLFRLYFERLYSRILSLLQLEGNARLVPGAFVLDVACGTGELIFRLAKKYPQTTFIGLDLTPAMVEKACQKGKFLSNVEFREGNAANLLFPNETFDIVLCSEAFHHFELPERALAEIYRVTKNSGLFLLIDPGFSSVVLTRITELIARTFEVNKHVYSQSELRELLQKTGFSIVSMSHHFFNNFFVSVKKSII